MDTSIQDLTDVLGFLEIAASRGCFNLCEFSAVGTAYSNLKRFVDSARPEVKRARKEERKVLVPPSEHANVVPESERGLLLPRPQ
jgi:hypothetical protein